MNELYYPLIGSKCFTITRTYQCVIQFMRWCSWWWTGGSPKHVEPNNEKYRSFIRSVASRWFIYTSYRRFGTTYRSHLHGSSGGSLKTRKFKKCVMLHPNYVPCMWLHQGNSSPSGYHLFKAPTNSKTIARYKQLWQDGWWHRTRMTQLWSRQCGNVVG